MAGEKGVPGRVLVWPAFILGVLLLAGGLIFLCAAVQNPARWPVALALLLFGGGLVGWSGLVWRRVHQLSPEVVDARITELAASRDAEVTVSQLVSELGVSETVAREALARLSAGGMARRERRKDREVYVFPGLTENKVVRRCTYCGNRYSVREPLYKCPNCGGTLELVKE